jgi:hypothetical protein
VEAKQVGVVLAQEVGYIHGGAAAFTELPSPEVEVFSDTGCKSVIGLLYPTMHLFLDAVNRIPLP